jgi:N12 class adenine-specific DNA methylase
MRATAGTEVVVDLLVFQRRADGEPVAGAAWIDLAEVANAADDADGADNAEEAVTRGNRYFAEYPEMVLGEHTLRRGIYGPGPTYTCRPRQGPSFENALNEALDRLPTGIFTAPPESKSDDATELDPRAGTAADGATIKEGSYLIGDAGRLMQFVDGAAHPVAIKTGRGADGIPARDAKIIRALLPIRDAVRDLLRAQAADQPWADAQIRLRIAYSGFVRPRRGCRCRQRSPGA